MKLTPILYVRSWISKLHPPMLTTKKENKQLLSLLNSSFHRQLDEAHPPIQPIESPSQHGTPMSGPRLDNPSARATRNHLQSLLQHPLLSQADLHYTRSQDGAFIAARMMDLAMLHGEGDVGLVYRSMKVYERTLQHGGTKAQEDRYGIGEKIVAWFTSSTAATKEKFLSSRHILNVTVPVMYAEGQEGAVWEWLAMLYSRNFGSGISYPGNDPDVSSRHPEWVIQEIDLIRFMIKEDLRRGRLDTAVLQFIKASDYMQRTGRMSSETQSSRNWQATINAMTFAILQRRHRHGLPDHLFDNLVEHRSLWSSSSTFASELVLLYHPTRPSAKELVNAINQAHDQVQVRFSRIETMREHGKKIILNSLLDGAQLLLEQKSNFVKEAQLILDLIEEQFPDMAAREGNEVTEKRIQSVRQIICPQEVMPTPIGIA